MTIRHLPPETMHRKESLTEIFDRVEDKMDRLEERIEESFKVTTKAVEDLCRENGVDPYAAKKPKLTLIQGGKAR